MQQLHRIPAKAPGRRRRAYHVIVAGQHVNTITARNKDQASSKAKSWIVNTLGQAVDYRIQACKAPTMLRTQRGKIGI